MAKFNCEGLWLGFVCAVFTLVAGCGNQTENLSKKNLWLESTKADLGRFPDRFIEDSKSTFLRTDNITALLLAGGASIAMHNSDADKNIAENFARHRTFHGFADEGLSVIGDPPTHFAATGLWYAISAENQDELNKQRAFMMMTALSVTGVVTTGLKAIRNNDTPNGQSWAWPSGHTSSSFTVASVLDEFYGPKVGIPAYALASLIAYRMMDTGDHWGSDVIFGATLGWVVGHTVAGKHKNLEVAGFEIVPYFGIGNCPANGICLVKQF
jgi:membrane-associated phospholipid phosphatase